MKTNDPVEWAKCVANNSKDGYSKGVVDYTIRWADLMEAELAKGKKLEDVADKTSHEADTEGITGFMYGCAVWMLSKFWEYGKALRKWHNLKTQLRDEGERANRVEGRVLNPAILNVGGKGLTPMQHRIEQVDNFLDALIRQCVELERNRCAALAVKSAREFSQSLEGPCSLSAKDSANRVGALIYHEIMKPSLIPGPQPIVEILDGRQPCTSEQP